VFRPIIRPSLRGGGPSAYSFSPKRVVYDTPKGAKANVCFTTRETKFSGRKATPKGIIESIRESINIVELSFLVPSFILKDRVRSP
jgi:hypothetical protein